MLLPFLLDEYRSVPQESTGFAPFDVLYERQVRGPLDLTHDSWEGSTENTEQPVGDCLSQFKKNV